MLVLFTGAHSIKKLGKISYGQNYNTPEDERQRKLSIKRKKLPLMNLSLAIASHNPGKYREIKAILHGLQINILTGQELGINISVDESGETYEENAQIKALAYLNATGLPVIADDSGVEVDVLNGAPGLHSARYSNKPNATNADRRIHLLEELHDKPQPWTAHFHCSAVLALPNGEIFTTSGRCEGIIIPEERGIGGFGYDPVFYMPDYQLTMAELPDRIKNQISHRAKAFAAMIPIIQSKLIKS